MISEIPLGLLGVVGTRSEADARPERIGAQGAAVAGGTFASAENLIGCVDGAVAEGWEFLALEVVGAKLAADAEEDAPGTSKGREMHPMLVLGCVRLGRELELE